MSDDQHEEQCDYGHGSLAEIHRKLDRLDEAIRGNGKPGILIRLDRLEQAAQRHAKLIWSIVGALVAAAASGLVAWITGT